MTFMEVKDHQSSNVVNYVLWLPNLVRRIPDASLSQQHGTNETRNTLNNNLNTNLMQGHRDSSVSPCSLPEITEHRIFYILFYCEQISLKGIIFCT